jgi:hypothetical protein
LQYSHRCLFKTEWIHLAQGQMIEHRYFERFVLTRNLYYPIVGLSDEDTVEPEVIRAICSTLEIPKGSFPGIY